MWSFSQSNGAVRNAAGAIIGLAYAGHGAGLNNPAMQEIRDVGPIPQGRWSIGPLRTLPHLGPCMALTPLGGTDTFGRSGFLIHEDNAQHDHSASCGCVVVSPSTLSAMDGAPDRILTVTP